MNKTHEELAREIGLYPLFRCSKNTSTICLLDMLDIAKKEILELIDWVKIIERSDDRLFIRYGTFRIYINSISQLELRDRWDVFEEIFQDDPEKLNEIKDCQNYYNGGEYVKTLMVGFMKLALMTFGEIKDMNLPAYRLMEFP